MKHFTVVFIIFCIYICVIPEAFFYLAESRENGYRYMFMAGYMLFFPLFYLSLKVDKLKYRNKLAEDCYVIFKGEDK